MQRHQNRISIEKQKSVNNRNWISFKDVGVPMSILSAAADWVWSCCVLCCSRKSSAFWRTASIVMSEGSWISANFACLTRRDRTPSGPLHWVIVNIPKSLSMLYTQSRWIWRGVGNGISYRWNYISNRFQCSRCVWRGYTTPWTAERAIPFSYGRC